MSDTNQILFQLNIGGNANRVINDISQSVQNTNVKVNNLTKIFEKFGKISIVFNQFSSSLREVNASIEELSAPGIEFNKNMQELSAITGVTGKGLQEIGEMAKDVAKTFATDASDSVESFKLLLSQLSPELGKTPEVMKKMGEDIAILSKTMGGDTVAAAEVLTTAMNQYQVSMEDPIEAEKEMARMMNVMAAAAKEGSAELPQIQEALKQAGMAAKTAGVSFEETNAAIQVLDKAGKKGSEGGVALRNVMTTLAAGRFLPKDVQEELQRAGININILTDRSRSLQERLQTLKPVMQDQALLTKLFGRENSAAAIALISGTKEMEEYTQAVTGTNTAVEQAQTIMEAYEQKQKKFHTQIESLKISLFEATGGLTMYVSEIGSMLVPVAQLIPIFSGISSVVKVLTQGIMYLPTLFKTVASVASVACKGISVAIGSIPIVGWIAIAVAAIAGLVAYFWNTSAKFRAVIKGSWAYVVSITKEAWEVLKGIFTALGDMIKAAVHLDFDGVKEAAKGFVGVFEDFGKQSAEAYEKAYNEEIEKSKKEQEAKDKKEDKAKTKIKKSGIADEAAVAMAGANMQAETTPVGVYGASASSRAGGGGSSADRSITTNIENLINGDIVINSTTVSEGAAQIKRLIIEALQDATNEVSMSY